MSSSKISGRRTINRAWFVLFLGLAVGGAIGYYFGRQSVPAAAPTAQPSETGAQATAAPAQGMAAQGGTTAAANTPAMPPQPAPSTPEALGLPADAQHVDVTIKGSLYSTLAKAISEGRQADILTAHIGRLLVWWVSIKKDVLNGDRVQMIYRPAEGPAEIQVLALKYFSTKNGKTYRTYYHRFEGEPYGRFYQEDGSELELRLKESPLAEYEQITEIMNMAGRRHHGIDFKTDVGNEVRTPFRARVLRRNWTTRRNGNCLELLYTETGIHAFFLHLDQVLPETQPGKVLPAGTLIAHSGNTGHSTAPHLHYELRSSNGRQLNPLKVQETFRKKLQAPRLEEFLQDRDKYDRYFKVISEQAPESGPAPSASMNEKKTTG